MTDLTKTERTERNSEERFLYEGGYQDRMFGYEPQQKENRHYLAGYADAICDEYAILKS